MDQKSHERWTGFALLTPKGDFVHNMRVIESKEGELIMARNDEQPSVTEYWQYGPCPYFYRLFKYDLLHRHVKHCPVGTTVVKDVTYRSRALMQGSKDGAEEFIHKKVRQLGRLLLELRKITGGTRSLQDYILDLPMFDTIIKGVRRLCREHSKKGVPHFEKSGLALHLGHQLKKRGFPLAGLGVRSRDSEMEANAEEKKKAIVSSSTEDESPPPPTSNKNGKRPRVECYLVTN